MLYRQKKDTYIRNYDGAGYITSTGIWNDRMVNESGTVFLCALSREPQTLDELAEKIIKSFVGVDKETIKKDAEEFYETLIEDGFIIKGETKEELDAKDTGFTYNAVLPKTEREDFTPTIQRADSDTQEFLEKHFKDKPHLTQFQIELTSKCNERCVHCYIPHDLKLYDITEEMYYNTLEQLSKMGVLSVTLSGGEPMCHPKFKEFLRAAKKYDFYVNILSNLTYFFETYGCEMNIAESAAVEQLLIARGWKQAASAQVADLAIINTCSVRGSAEERIEGRLGWFNGLKAVRSCKIGAKTKLLDQAVEYVKDGPKPLTLVVMGCMAERMLNEFHVKFGNSKAWGLGEWSCQIVTNEMGFFFGGIVWALRLGFCAHLFFACYKKLRKNKDLLPICLWTLSVPYFGNGNINLTMTLGWIVIVMILLLTSIKTSEKIKE